MSRLNQRFLRLPNKLQAALFAALASVSFTTLSSGTLAVATGAALLAGQQAAAETKDQLNTALTELRTLNNYMAGDDYTFSFTLTTVGTSGTGTILTLASGYYFNTQQGTYGGLSTTSGGVSGGWPDTTSHEANLNVWNVSERLAGWISRDANGTGTGGSSLNGSTITVKYSADTSTTTFELYHKNKATTDRVIMTGVALNASEFSFGTMTNAGTDLVFRSGTDYVWNGTTESATWNAANTNWLVGEESKALTSTGNALFTSAAAEKTVTIGENVAAKNVLVQDNYTFVMGGHTVSATVGMVLASGKTLTLSGAGTLDVRGISGGGNITKTGDGTLTIDGAAGGTIGSLTVSGGALDIATAVTVTNAMALPGSNPTIHVKDGGTLTISTASTVGNNKLVNGVSGEAGSPAFTNLFKGNAVDVQAGGKLVLVGNVFATHENGSGGTLQSGVASLEIQGNFTLNTWNATTYNLGTHSMKVTGDAWLKNHQLINMAGGSFEVGGALKMAHEGNDQAGQYLTTITATGNSTVKAREIQFYGGHNELNVNGSTLSFTKDGSNVLSMLGDKTPTADADLNKVILTDAKLKADTNSWTLAPISGAAVTASGTTTLDVAAGKTINLTASSINGTFAMSGGGEANIHGSGTLTSTITVDSSTLTLDGTYAIDGLEPDADSEIIFIDDQGQEHKDGSGFRKTAGTKSVYTTTGQEASVTWSDATKFTVNGAEVEVGADGKYHFESTTDYTTLWVNNAETVDYASYKTGPHGATLTTVRMQTGGTLSLADGATVETLRLDGNGSTTNAAGTTATIQSLAGTAGFDKQGEGKLILTGDNSAYTGPLSVNAGTLEITNANSLGSGTHTVNAGAAILLTNNDMSTIGTLNVQGDGDLRLVTGKTDSSHGLRTVSAHNLKLQDNGSHNSRFVYENGSDLSGVNHLFFDGAQLWINGKNLEFTKAVTFNGSTFTGDSGNLRNAAIRQGNSNTVFSGAVEIAANTRLTWDADTAKTSDINFAGTLSGSGNLELLHFRQSGTFTISGDASEYAGKITSDSSITLRVTNSGKLALGDGSVLDGAVSLAGALTVNGSVTVNGSLTQTAGSITVNQDKSLTLGAAAITSAINSTGTVVFTQDITATGLQKVGDDVSYSVGADDAAATNNNYFSNGQRTESTIRVVTGGTVTTGDHTVTQDSVAYALKADGTATGVTADGVDYSVFYQGQAGTTVNVSQLAATATKHGAELQAVQSTGAGGTPTELNVDQDLASAMVAFSTVNIGSDVTYTGNLLVFGGMNTVSGQIDIAKVGFYSGYASVTTFTDAPVVNGGVRFTSDAELGGVQVQANKLSGVEEGYYAYAANDYHYSVAASELSKEGADASDVDNSLMVSRIHNSEETATGKLMLHAGAVAAVLNEVVATSGDVEFLNMAAANEGIGSDVPQLNNLVIGTDKTVSFYKEGAPANEGDEVAEATVTVAGTLTAGTGAMLNANLVMDGSGNGTPAPAVLDVHAMGGNGGLNMGSSVTLNPYNVALSDEDMALIGDLGFMGKYDLFNGVDSFILGSNPYAQIGMSDAWVNARDVFSGFALPTDKDYYLFYSGANTAGGMGGNVGTIYVMQIPEPTTGTLSLLALAALAARKRRK